MPEMPQQKDLFADASAAESIALPGAALRLFRRPDLGRPPEQLFDLLYRELAWAEENITLYGKTYRQPRQLAWYGDREAVYRYSGRRHDPLPWHPLLAELRERVASLCGSPFNSVLANLYRDHRDCMGLHADDERALGPQPVIASLSLGAQRVFCLRARARDRLPRSLRLPLASGSLLVMSGDTQRNWKHEIPRSLQPCGPRINLTFRLVRPTAGP